MRSATDYRTPRAARGHHRRPRRRPGQDSRGAKLYRLALAARDERRIQRAERAAGEAVVL